MSVDSGSSWWRPQESARVAERDIRELPGSRLTFWALIGFTVILLLAPQEQFAALAPLRIALVSVAVACLAYVVNRLSLRMPLLEFSPGVVLALMLAAWAIFTIPFSYWPGGSVGFLTGTYLKAVICFLLLSHAISNFQQLLGISWCLVLCSVPLALHTIGNYVAGTHIDGSERVLGYASGLAQNPNDMALMLNLILPLCIALMLGSRSSMQKMILAGVAVLIVVAVIATFSRAGFLTLMFIGICYAWLLRHRPQRIWIPIILIMGIFALPMVPSSYFERLDTIINIEEDQTNSAQTRLADMKVAVDLAFSKPIVGSGVGMSSLALNEARGENWLDVHNVYLQLAVDIGFIGLALFLLLLLHCLRVSNRITSASTGKGTSQRMAYLAEALRVSLLAFALSAMFYPVAYNFYFYFFAGMVIAAGRISRTTTPELQS
jgi:probable O-glycosylation ligase (exosortase A-associated)